MLGAPVWKPIQKFIYLIFGYEFKSLAFLKFPNQNIDVLQGYMWTTFSDKILLELKILFDS